MQEYTIGIAGNPYVGKSTIFNALTGRNQHMTTWCKTTQPKPVGKYLHGETIYHLIELPGSYSLMDNGKDDRIARDFIYFGHADAILLVCDATRLEQGLILLLQTLELTGTVILCLNRMDDAQKKLIAIDCTKLQSMLGIPVVATVAKNLEGLLELIDCLDFLVLHKPSKASPITYAAAIEDAIALLTPYLEDHVPSEFPTRWIAHKLMEHDQTFLHSLEEDCGIPLLADDELQTMLLTIQSTLELSGIYLDNYLDMVASAYLKEADRISSQVVHTLPSKKNYLSQNLARLLNYTKR